jgi:hypothetical protein
MPQVPPSAMSKGAGDPDGDSTSTGAHGGATATVTACGVTSGFSQPGR